MYYEINVSKDGKHVFATSERSLKMPHELKAVYKLFKEKFPESEGYVLTVTKWERRGYELEVK